MIWAAQRLNCHKQGARRLPQQALLSRLARHLSLRTNCVGSSSSSSSAATSARLQQVLDGIDALNAQDPRTVSCQGVDLPYELAYSQWLSDWVLKLEQQPSEELRIVARGQHVERWKTPRSSYPEGKAGYLQWREGLKAKHAATVVGLMQAAGYDESSQQRVTRFILKKDLKKDPENQAVEDALCLVFMQHQFADLLQKEGADKMVDIVRKTWGKMGERGRAAALELALPEDQAQVVQRALSG
ncbi:hypothetical protein COO60DRAFT_1222437 [Scenedesmus sp. NREL 46B-D3]|nr:hypothetical protein COO60DRAFT_1222437 [Scenedesmus sp. NREL 46B-D3]